MSTLGDYIHYYWNNYEKYGTYRNNKSNYSMAQSIFNNEKENMLSKIQSKNSANVKQLETALKGMLYPSTESDKNTNAQMKQYLQATLAGMLTKWASQDGLGIKGHHANKDSFKFGETKGYSLPNIRDLENRAKQSLQLIQKAGLEGDTSLINQLNTIISLTQQAQGVAKSYLNKNEFASYSAMARGSMNTKNKYQNIIKQINETLLLLSTATYTQALGTSFEHAIATLDDRVQNAAYGTAIELIKNTIVTGNNTNKITLSGFDPYMKEVKGTIEQYTDPKTGAKVTWNEQGTIGTSSVVYKMDVDLVYQGEQFKISAKNYSLENNNNIHLVSSTPLLTSLMRNVSNDFINHSMNILFAKQGNSNQKRLMKDAHQAIKRVLMIEAVTGISQKNGFADTLVINNRSSQTVKVVPIANLLKLDDIDNMVTFSGYSALDKNLNVWYKPGSRRSWSKSKHRIDNLLNQLHAIKISLSINYNKITI